MSLLTKFIEKELQDKKQQRWVIDSNDFFNLVFAMGIMEQEELLMDILEYLEENKIDIHFSSPEKQNQFQTFKKIEQGYRIRKQMKGYSEEIKKNIEKVMGYKPNVSDDFLLEYMTDDEEYIQNLNATIQPINKDIQELQEKITKQIHQEMLEKVPQTPNLLIEYLRNNP